MDLPTGRGLRGRAPRCCVYMCSDTFSSFLLVYSHDLFRSGKVLSEYCEVVAVYVTGNTDNKQHMAGRFQ